VTITKTEITRTPPPPLVLQLPLCPLCEDEVYAEDNTLRCVPCGASWSGTSESIGRDAGAWEKDDWDSPIPRCASTIQPWATEEKYPRLKSMTFRCDLNEDHLDVDPSQSWDGTQIGDPLRHRHVAGSQTWDWVDDDADVIVPTLGPEERATRAEERQNAGEIAYREYRKQLSVAASAPVPRPVETVPTGEVL